MLAFRGFGFIIVKLTEHAKGHFQHASRFGYQDLALPQRVHVVGNDSVQPDHANAFHVPEDGDRLCQSVLDALIPFAIRSTALATQIPQSGGGD